MAAQTIKCKRSMHRASRAFLGVLFCVVMYATAFGVELQQDDKTSRLVIVVDGQESLIYQYGAEFSIPHYWPLRSPSGKLLTVQHPDPYPHHRSLWIADKIQAVGAPAVDFYHCWKNYRDPDVPESGYRHFIRHQKFDALQVSRDSALVESQLRWIVNDDQPVLDEACTLRVISLGQGEYLLDLNWELTAAHGDVKFLSDQVHYAWPYVRMHPQFSGEQGGTIASDQGHHGQAETHDQPAKWIDFSNTVDGTTEGLAVFVDDDAGPRKWLTREYGTFGPRRTDEFSGTQFTLPSGKSLQGRAGILIHRGDVESGRVADRYQQYLEMTREIRED